MAQIRRSLGPKVWACLGSSDAFNRTRSHLRLSIASGDVACQEPEANGDPPSLLSDTSPSPPSSSRRGLPGRGMVKRERQTAGGRKTGRQQLAQKQGGSLPNVGKKPEKEQEDTGKDNNKDRGEGGAGGGGWDQYLSQKATLAIDAVMWTIATERERTVTCEAIIAQQGKLRKRQQQQRGVDATNTAARVTAPTQQRENPPQGNKREKGRTRGGEGTGDSQSPAKKVASASLASLGSALTVATAAVEGLRVSMPAARRFVKRSSGLMDGVSVVDADVDLAFKKWEEVGRFVRRRDGYPSTTSASTAEGGGESTACLVTKGKVDPAFDHTAEAATTLLQRRQCEAVGCSDPARYGDIHPMAKARLCRNHRRNGMVDVGSRR